MTLPLRDLWCAVRDGDPDSEGRPGCSPRPGTESATPIVPIFGETPADVVLVARVRGGDREAFESIVSAYAQDVVQLAAIMLHDRDDAEDVAQELFVRVWHGRESWVLRGSLRAYLLRAAANQVRNVRNLRANRRRLVAAEGEQLVPTGGRNDAEASLDAMLWQAVRELPERWRDAVLLRYVQRLSFAEVAEVLGVTEDAAKKVVRRAIEGLRRVLADRVERED